MTIPAHSLDVLFYLPPSYTHSAELRLAYRQFLQALPTSARVIVSDTPAALSETIQRSQADYLLLVREPGLLLSAQGITQLAQVLDAHPELAAVLPADLRDHPSAVPPYLSLRGFERYTAGLAAQTTLKTYDGREPLLLLVRRAALPAQLPATPINVATTLACACVPSVFVHAFFDYYQHSRDDLLPLLPTPLASLLDIGCARGEFGAAVKAARGCRVVGLELDPLAAAAARERLDQVWVGDALQFTPDERYDCVSCLDTLEHLAEPEALLRRIREQCLKPQGWLLLSVPNVGHWSLIEDLLAGRWDYVPAGLLCNTHLRFFTQHSLQLLLQTAGFQIVHTQPVRLSPPAALSKALASGRAAGFDINETSLETLAFHVLARVC